MPGGRRVLVAFLAGRPGGIVDDRALFGGRRGIGRPGGALVVGGRLLLLVLAATLLLELGLAAGVDILLGEVVGSGAGWTRIMMSAGWSPGDGARRSGRANHTDAEGAPAEPLGRGQRQQLLTERAGMASQPRDVGAPWVRTRRT